MPAKDKFDFSDVGSIPVFSFNKDLSRLALSPNNELVNIYRNKSGNWELESTLTEHTERVTGIDWAKNGKILTCAADRNAYVWTEEKPKEWRQALVLLRIDRAAISARWAPMENKFAIGTGSKLICVCYYEEANNWWVSKHIKKPIRSSVLCIAWHPTGNVIAAGSSDFKVRVFAAGVKEIEKKPEATRWGDKLAFGALLYEVSTGYSGWIHSVAFSPNGNCLAWVAHDSTVGLADVSGSAPITSVLKLKGLPFLTCSFPTDKIIIAAGHDNSPYKITWSGKELSLDGDIDTVVEKAAKNEQSAMSRFRNMDKMAQTNASVSKASDKTHANTITCLTLLSGGNFATSGLDNKVVIWEKA